MNWIDHLEQRSSLVIGGTLLICIAALIVTSLRGPAAYDPFWHLKMGEDWIVNGLSPWIDHYSFTYAGHTVSSPPVAFQAALYQLVSQFGLNNGFVVFKLVNFTLILGAAFLLLRQINAPTMVQVLVLPVVAYLLQMRAMVRPELTGYAFLVVALMLYFRAGKNINTRSVLPMVLLMVVWTNYHTSIVGYVVFFGFFLDCAVEQIRTRAPAVAWAKWFGWGVVVVAAGFLNAEFSHPVLKSVGFSSQWKILINEFLPPAPFPRYRTAGIGAVALLALLVPVLAYRERRYGALVVWGVMLYAAVTMQRLVTPAGIVIALLFAYLATTSNLFRSPGPAGRRLGGLAGVLCLALVAVMLYSVVERAHYYMKASLATITRYPDAMVNYMLERGMTGPIFNDYGIGGYLIYRLAPASKVYIDGRTQILYPLEHLHRYMDATVSARHLRAEVDRFGIDRIVLQGTSYNHGLVTDMGGFGLDFVDALHVLYTRGTANFPTLGELLSRPACWRPDMAGDLNLERRRMDMVLPYYSALYPFADFVTGYANAAHWKEYFDTSIEEDAWSDEMRRFAGFRFLEAGRPDIAVMLFGGIDNKKPQDYLGVAMALFTQGTPETAAQVLTEMAGVRWTRLQPGDAYVQYRLYQSLGQHRPLTPGEQAVSTHLLKQLDEFVLPGQSGMPDPHLLCEVPGLSRAGAEKRTGEQL